MKRKIKTDTNAFLFSVLTLTGCNQAYNGLLMKINDNNLPKDSRIELNKRDGDNITNKTQNKRQRLAFEDDTTIPTTTSNGKQGVDLVQLETQYEESKSFYGKKQDLSSLKNSLTRQEKKITISEQKCQKREEEVTKVKEELDTIRQELEKIDQSYDESERKYKEEWARYQCKEKEYRSLKKEYRCSLLKDQLLLKRIRAEINRLAERSDTEDESDTEEAVHSNKNGFVITSYRIRSKYNTLCKQRNELKEVSEENKKNFEKIKETLNEVRNKYNAQEATLKQAEDRLAKRQQKSDERRQAFLEAQTAYKAAEEQKKTYKQRKNAFRINLKQTKDVLEQKLVQLSNSSSEEEEGSGVGKLVIAPSCDSSDESSSGIED